MVSKIVTDFYGVAVHNRGKNDARVSDAWIWNSKVYIKVDGGPGKMIIKYGQSLDDVSSPRASRKTE